MINSQSSDGLDLCKKLSKMGVSCDMSIWSKPTFRVDPDDFGSRRGFHGFELLGDDSRCFDGFRNVSSARQVFLQNTSNGVSPGELRFLGAQDSVIPTGFEEMMALKNHRDFLLDQMNRPVKRLSPCLKSVSLEKDAFQGSLMSNALAAMDGSGASYPKNSLRGISLRNDAFKGSPMFEGKRVSQALDAMEVYGASYPENRLRGVSVRNDAFKGSSMFEEKRVAQALTAMEVSGAFCQEDSLRGVSLGNGAFKGSLMVEGKRVSQALAAMEVSGACLRGVSLGNDAFKGSSMFEGKRVSRALATMEVAGPSYPEDTLIRQGSLGKMSTKATCDLRLNLASMINIYGSVNLMAKDQIGCRALQELVDGGTFHDFKVLFLEIINNVAELSMDQFANYLVQKMLEMCDEEQRTLIVSVFTSNPMVLSKICLNNYGTRVVQKIIETVKTKQQIGMVKSGLEPCFLALVRDLNGNHVIQACLNFLSPNDNKFVLEAATKYCAEIATHRHGCCVLQCCVSNSVGEQRERLVDEISRNALQLSQDPFGNYVVQYIIEQNVPAGKLLMQFRKHYAKLATQKFSSHVVEKCLKHYPESRAEIVLELLSVPSFEYLLQDPFGNYVIQTALSKTKGRVQAQLVEQVQKYGMLKSSPYCKKIFSKRILKK